VPSTIPNFYVRTRGGGGGGGGGSGFNSFELI
jgi:hypothetical protein